MSVKSLAPESIENVPVFVKEQWDLARIEDYLNGSEHQRVTRRIGSSCEPARLMEGGDGVNIRNSTLGEEGLQ